MALMMQVPPVSRVALLPDTPQTVGVADVKITPSPDVAVAESAFSPPFEYVVADGSANEMLWLAFEMVRVNDWSLKPAELVARKIGVYVPTVPDAGVPDRDPAALIVTPVGSEPPAKANVGVGTPVATTVKLLELRTVNVVLAALVKFGATGVAVGFTVTVPEAGPVPVALVAVTEQA